MRPTLTQAEDIKLVLVAALLGMMIGALYDLFTFFRVMREKDDENKFERIFGAILCFLEDILFFMLVIGGNVVLFSAYGGNKVRLEGIVAQFALFILWHIGLSRISRQVFLKMKIKIKKLLGKIYGRTVVPIEGYVSRKIKKAKKKRELEKVKKYSERAKKELKSRFRQSIPRF